MKIGIEIDHILRNINFQIIKYYKKDIVKDFDDENINYNVIDIWKNIKFESKKKRFEFLFEDYPYEIFGCARTMSRHLSLNLNNFLLELSDAGDVDQVCLFSLKEGGLSIQSTYYFLSKIGCKVREVFFPTRTLDVWEKCDIVITTNAELLKNKPEGKIAILIKKDDIKDLEKHADYVFDSLDNVLEAKYLFIRPEKKVKTISWFSDLKNKVMKKIGKHV
jgi:hypothetical protein